MKRAVGCYGTILGVLLVLPGCGRLIDWGKSNFYQGKDLNNYSNQAKPFVRSVTIHDQFSTTGSFDALLLNQEVRTAYTDLHSARFAKSPEHKNAFLRRQLEEMDHYISFYVLSLYEVTLGVPESQWSLFLEVDGNTYAPTELKVTELPYEFQQFFGNKWNRFKEPYFVRFSATDIEDNPIITPTTKKITLHIRSANKGDVLSWNVNGFEEKPEPSKMVIKEKKKKKETLPRKSIPRKKRQKKSEVVSQKKIPSQKIDKKQKSKITTPKTDPVPRKRKRK